MTTMSGRITPATRNVLTTHRLTKTFGGVHAVDDVSVEFLEGKVNGLIGPNGSGKTTFFNMVTGMIKPDSGRVYQAEREITGWAPHRVARLGIGRSFQLCRVFPRLTVMDNMLVAVQPTSIGAALLGARHPATMDRAHVMLARVGIEHLQDAEARDISYGQQKLLELAAVLMSDPRIIMLDEPAGGVNPALIERIATLIRELNAEGKTFIVVEHNMELVMNLCDHIVVFDRGRPIASGEPAAIQSDPAVREAYLGI